MKKLSIPAIMLSFVCAAPAVAGIRHSTYMEPHQADSTQIGIASWYGHSGWHLGRRTASGERFDPQAMTCAHRTLPLGSFIKVTDVATGKDVVVQVNDRGPFRRGRIVDLSEGAARELGIWHKGLSAVRLEVVSEPVPST